MERKGSGIVIRLVLPLFLLLLLSAVTFWMTTEKRVDVTITIMLSVSALYIVILGNIPLVGYLTKLDKFVFWVSSLLVLSNHLRLSFLSDVSPVNCCCYLTSSLFYSRRKERQFPIKNSLYAFN